MSDTVKVPVFTKNVHQTGMVWLTENAGHEMQDVKITTKPQDVKMQDVKMT